MNIPRLHPLPCPGERALLSHLPITSPVGVCVFWALSCRIRREVKRRRDVPRVGRGVWEARILEKSTTGSDFVYTEINRRGKTEF